MRGQVVSAPVAAIPGWVPAQIGSTFLLLGDGTQVTEPEDIIPVVGADSVAGAAALRAHEAEAWSDALVVGGLGAFAVGAGVTIGGLVLAMTAIGDPDGVRAQDLANASLATSAVGLVVAGVGTGIAGLGSAEREAVAIDRATAFAAYNDGLDARMQAAANARAPAAPNSLPLSAPTSMSTSTSGSPLPLAGDSTVPESP